MQPASKKCTNVPLNKRSRGGKTKYSEGGQLAKPNSPFEGASPEGPIAGGEGAKWEGRGDLIIADPSERVGRGQQGGDRGESERNLGGGDLKQESGRPGKPGGRQQGTYCLHCPSEKCGKDRVMVS